MVQSPSWEANWFAASQEIPRISRNPKVHYRTNKCPPPVSILGQPNPVHIHTSHLLEIHFNIIHPSTPRSRRWSPSLRFPQQDPVHPSPLPYAPHAQPISFFSILLLVMQSPPSPRYLVAPSSKHSPQHHVLFSYTLSVLSSRNVNDQGTKYFYWISGVPRNFVWEGGGFNKFSWGQRTEKTGICGQQPLSQGFWGQL